MHAPRPRQLRAWPLAPTAAAAPGSQRAAAARPAARRARQGSAAGVRQASGATLLALRRRAGDRTPAPATQAATPERCPFARPARPRSTAAADDQAAAAAPRGPRRRLRLRVWRRAAPALDPPQATAAPAAAGPSTPP
eukprot:151317-Chlamydomonas_euryale.AAC.15